MAYLQVGLSSQTRGQMKKIKEYYKLPPHLNPLPRGEREGRGEKLNSYTIKLIKKNNGTAIILMLVVVSVLFIFTSFLVRKVVINATMVEKSGKEQESYAIAKQGILYAIDQLNTGEGYSLSYDPTDWPGDTDWHDYNLDNDTTTGDTSGNDVTLKVEKNTPSGYITIESQDLPKKLVTLQGIAENTGPLLNYVRFINSDVSFLSLQGFGDSANGAPFHINGNLILDGDANEIYLEDNQRFEVTGEVISYDSGSAQTDKVKILPSNEASFSSKTLDDDGSGSDGYGFTGTIVNGDEYSQLDPKAFNTVQGHYFDGVHLPSSYDYSENPNNPQYVSGQSIIFWPQINEERFWDSENGTTRLADLAISSDDCGKRGINDFAPCYWWDDWYPTDNTHPYGYSDIDGSTVANIRLRPLFLCR